MNKFLVVVLLFLSACSTAGPVSAPLVGGIAAVTAVFDQMLADDIIKPDQYVKLTKGMDGVQASLDAAQTAAQAATQIATEAKNGAVSPETLTGGLSATALSVLGAIRVWRGKPSKTKKTEPAVA